MGALGTIPPEAWDRTHPDHDWWVKGIKGRGWCYDPDCPDHVYRRRRRAQLSLVNEPNADNHTGVVRV